ncbi:MAG: DUF2125 domain-containing protein [Amaricoccus sp.]
MRILLAIVILAALGWSGFWWVNASFRERALNAWLAERRAAGWVAEAKDISVAGFPNRVDTTVTGLRLSDPDAGWSWDADKFEILSLSYQPHHVIAVLPGEQVFATPLDTFRLTSDKLDGSVIFRPTPRLELDRMTFEAGNLKLASDAGWTAGIGDALIATRQAAAPDAPPFSHDLAINLDRLALPADVVAALGADSVLPAAIDKISVDATLAFDRAWDRPALESGNPELERVDIRDITMTWGKLDLRGKGELAVDARGFADSRLDLKARNWRSMVDMAESSGLLLGCGPGCARRPGFAHEPFRRGRHPQHAARILRWPRTARSIPRRSRAAARAARLLGLPGGQLLRPALVQPLDDQSLTILSASSRLLP